LVSIVQVVSERKRFETFSPVLYADRKSKMATTAIHRLTLDPMGKCSNAFFSETTTGTTVPVVVVSSVIVVSSVVNVVPSVVEGYGQSFSGSVAGQFNVRFPVADGR
jgi:hypothetical protein